MKPRSYAAVVGFALLLLPCLWRAHIYAGDLSSHIYNAWLATLVEHGQAPGLSFHAIHTNLIFDVMLEALLKTAGSAWAQRIAVGLTVWFLAFAILRYARTTGGRNAWLLFPMVAMTCYGWLFHMGFMNYMISTAFSLLALAAWARPAPSRIAAGALLLAAGFAAHIFPVLWALSLNGYRIVHRMLKPRRTLALLAGSIALEAALSAFLLRRYESSWSPSGLLSATGSDQFWLFGQYTVVFVPLILILWVSLLVSMARARSGLRILLGFPAQAVIVTAAAAFILPYYVLPPGYPWGFGYTPQRISLLVAISICTLLSAARPRLPETVLMYALCAAYFVSIYVNDGQLSRVEENLTRMVDALPPYPRVVTSLHVPWRTNQLDHLVDRVCVERCISYADYEPVTGQFRIQTDGTSTWVAPDYNSFFELQQGLYRPPPRSPDYYFLNACPPHPWGLDAPLCVEHVLAPR